MTKRGAKKDAVAETTEEKKLSNHAQRKYDERKKGEFLGGLWWKCGFLTVSGVHGAEGKIDPLLETQFAAGRLYAAISSRPGQSGRADGYILEGKELEVSRSLATDCLSGRSWSWC